MRVKKIKVPIINSDRKSNKKNEFESVNGVLLKTNRLDTVITVDTQGNVIAVSGENPKNTKIGDNIYE